MKKISNNQIEKSLQRSINNFTSKKISSNILINYKEDYNMIKKKNIFLKFAPTFVIIAIAVFMGIYYYNHNLKIYSTITMDVNPSILLSTNYNDKVIKVEALNDDGQEILENINVNNLSPEEAINSIIDELKNENYLNSDGSNILITVQNNDLAKAKEIENSILISANQKLDDEYIAGTIIAQTDTIRKNIDSDVKNLMNKYNISYSKALFIRNIVNKDSDLNSDNLAQLKINEISKLISENKTDISDIVGHNKDDSFYESATLTQARKTYEEAEQNKVQAEIKVESINEEMQNQNNASMSKAMEDAEKEKQIAEQEAIKAQNAYEEVAKETNLGETTNNVETNQNQNSQITSTNSNGNQQNTNSTTDNNKSESSNSNKK